MANHSITINFASSQLRELKTTLKDIEAVLDRIADTIDRTTEKLSAAVIQLKQVATGIPNLKLAAPKPGTPATSGQRRQPKQVTPPPVIPTMKSMMADAWKSFNMGNLSGFSAKFWNAQVKFGSGSMATIGKLVRGFQAALAVMGPVGLAVGAVVGVFSLLTSVLSKVIGLVYSFVNELTRLNTLSLGGKQKYIDRATYLGQYLGKNREDVMRDAMNFKGGPEVFYKLIQQLRAIPDENAANEFAKSVGLQDYLGVRQMSNTRFNEAMNNKGTSLTNGLTPLLKSVLDEMAVNFRIIVDGLKQFASMLLVLLPHFWALGLYLKYLANIMRGVNIALTHFYEWLRKILHIQDASKEQKDAAKKLGVAADKLIDAAGYYGGGQRFARGLRGVQFDPTGTNAGDVRRHLKGLGFV